MTANSIVIAAFITPEQLGEMYSAVDKLMMPMPERSRM